MESLNEEQMLTHKEPKSAMEEEKTASTIADTDSTKNNGSIHSGEEDCVLQVQDTIKKQNFSKILVMSEQVNKELIDGVKEFLKETYSIFDYHSDKIKQIYEEMLKQAALKQEKINWSKNEVNLLVWLVAYYSSIKNIDFNELDDEGWKDIAFFLNNRNAEDCKLKWSYLGKNQIQIKKWTPEEDFMLSNLISKSKNGKINWKQISKEISLNSSTKIVRLARQCRERWINHLNPNLKKGKWTNEENIKLLEGVLNLGGKWAKISRLIPGRTEHAVKNQFKHLNRLYKLAEPGETNSQEQERKISSLIQNLKGKLYSDTGSEGDERNPKALSIDGSSNKILIPKVIRPAAKLEGDETAEKAFSPCKEEESSSNLPLTDNLSVGKSAFNKYYNKISPNSIFFNSPQLNFLTQKRPEEILSMSNIQFSFPYENSLINYYYKLLSSQNEV